MMISYTLWQLVALWFSVAIFSGHLFARLRTLVFERQEMPGRIADVVLCVTYASMAVALLNVIYR